MHCLTFLIQSLVLSLPANWQRLIFAHPPTFCTNCANTVLKPYLVIVLLQYHFTNLIAYDCFTALPCFFSSQIDKIIRLFQQYVHCTVIDKQSKIQLEKKTFHYASMYKGQKNWQYFWKPIFHS